MGLSAREAFKVGFLAKCAEDGLTVDQIRARVKAAYDAGSEGLQKGADSFSPGKFMAGLGSGAAYYGGLGLLAAPLAAGALGGYGLARLNDADDTDVDDVKRQELIDEYRRQSHRLRMESALREQLPIPRRGSRLGH